MPSTLPATGLTVAMVLSLLVQVPPEVASPRVDIEPTHSFVIPVMADTTGSAFTVSGVETEEEHPKLFVSE